MNIIPVSLGDRSYSVVLGSLPRYLPAFLEKYKFEKRNALLVTMQAIHNAGHDKPVLRALKAAGIQVQCVVLPNGEKAKNLKTFESLSKKALLSRLDRKSLIVALGGGVVTDMAGFVAATYMRGISYISIPTTLLAMVDASIGGKTGLNLEEGKNLVGAFWQPRLVWLDPAFLKTLPRREWKTGFAEVIKYGVIKDASFFSFLEREVKINPRIDQWSERNLLHILNVSASTKAQVVQTDERETPLQGGREILNFGHTLGHALEAATRYQTLSHGEAISIGMVFAGKLARAYHLWNNRDQERLVSLFLKVGLPVIAPHLTPHQKKVLWRSLQSDKKHIAGALRFVLPIKMGSVMVKSGINFKVVQNLLAAEKKVF